MVDLQNVTVKYGNNVVYQNFSFTFKKGVNVVLGKSGCGKTTLLKTIAQLVDYSGKCQADGKIAVVFQRPCLAPVSVMQNVKLVSDANENQLCEILRQAEILHKRNENAAKLSGGEQQRVALARMFAAQGEVLLLDEPFSNLDYGAKTSLRRTFLNMTDGDKTVIFVTHDIEDAVAVADRVYLLEGNPCQISFVAQPQTPARLRDEFGDESNVLRQTLHNLFNGAKC